jgi:hypothetical protein
MISKAVSCSLASANVMAAINLSKVSLNLNMVESLLCAIVFMLLTIDTATPVPTPSSKGYPVDNIVLILIWRENEILKVWLQFAIVFWASGNYILILKCYTILQKKSGLLQIVTSKGFLRAHKKKSLRAPVGSGFMQ